LVVFALISGCGKSEPVASPQQPSAISPPVERSVPPLAIASSPATAASLPPPASGATTNKPAVPADLAAFRARRDACDHFRGEDPYDAKRAAFLAAEVAKACTGTDRELADLRKRYAGDAKVMGVLERYEDKIE
jgi:hypothetical protein